MHPSFWHIEACNGPHAPSMVKSESPLLMNALEGLLEASLNDLTQVAVGCYNAHSDLSEACRCILFPQMHQFMMHHEMCYTNPIAFHV